ncbi:hypothetical protein J6X04_01075 [Candidatus Saccharibacteria bacterium]|nr:hypothetical protein [Candidatus Saccharibacteria bacterium]
MSKFKFSLMSLFILVCIAIINGAVFTNSASASKSLSEEDEAMFSQNNILFYQPCELQSGGSSEICDTNQNYAGEQVWSDAQMKAVEAHQPFYEKAANQYGIPWQILAVVHMREHSLVKDNPSNGQGVYQFYSSEERAACKGGVFTPGKISDEQFQIQTDCAAKRIKEHYGSGLDLSTDDGIKRMFFKYNGTAQAYINQALRLGFSQKEADNGEGSPYVMNRYDAKREPSSTWGQIKTDGGSIEFPANDQFGAFVLYKAIACDNAGTAIDNGDDDSSEPDTGEARTSSSNISGGAKSISDAAAALAWPKGTDSSKYHTKDGSGRYPAYAEAVEELGLKGHGHTYQPDCGDFVETVVKYSGYDKKFGKSNSYVQKHPELWEFISWDDGDTSKLQAGDVVYGNGGGSGTGQHWWVVAEVDGKLYRAEASYTNNNWGRITKEVKGKWKHYPHQWIYRAKGGGTAPSCNPEVVGNNNINATGAALAWPLGSKESDYTKKSPLKGKPYPAFEKAFSELFPNYNDDTFFHYMDHPYCSGFTAVVVRYSGYDKKFTNAMMENEPTQALKADRKLWDVIDWNGDKSELQGGDIINCISFDHSWMVIEDKNGKLYTAEGSRSHWTFGHIIEYKNKCNGKGKIIRAKNANNSSAGVSVNGDMQSFSTTGTVAKPGKGNGNIGASAIELAWPQGTAESTIQKGATNKFSNYFNSLSQSQSDKGTCYAGGKSCDRFVATAVRYSGADKDMAFGPVTSTLDYLLKSDLWEEVKMKNSKTVDEYQSGDVLIFYKPGASSPSHTAIFAKDSDGKGHVVQASYCEYFGVVKGTNSITGSYWGSIRVFRNKNNNTNSASTNCDLCAGQTDSDSSGGGTLQDGGFTSVEEAEKAVMEEYRSMWNNNAKARKYGINVGCNGILINNCPSFVRYFVNKYAQKRWTEGATGHGKDVAGNIAKFYKLKTDKTPSAYSVFSGPGTGWEGHTGIVLGVNTESNKIIIGEAGCGSGLDFIHAKEKDLSSYNNGAYTFTNLNSVLKQGSL